MKKGDNIEDILRDKLSSRKFDIKPEWQDDINKRLDEYNDENKSRFILFAWIAAAVLLVSVVSYFSINNGVKTDNLNQNNNSALNATTKHYDTLSNDTQTGITASSKSNQRIESSNNLKNTKALNNSNGASTSVIPTDDREIITIEPELDIKLPIATKDIKIADIESKEDIPEKQNEPKPATDTIPNDDRANQETIAVNMQDSISKESWQEGDGNNEDSELEEKDNNQEDKRKNNKTLKWDLGLVFGPSISNNNLSSNITTPSFNKRIAEESNTLFSEVGMDVTMHIKDKWTISSGLMMTKYGEKLNYTPFNLKLYDTTFRARDTVITKIDTIINPNNIRDTVFDTTFNRIQDTVVDNIAERDSLDNSPLSAGEKTSFTYIEVPFTIGFPIFRKPSFTIYSRVGASVGFLTKTTGKYYHKSQLVTASSSKVIFNALINIGIDYDIGSNMALRLDLHGRTNLTNLSTFTDINRRYTNYGLQLGLVYRF